MTPLEAERSIGEEATILAEPWKGWTVTIIDVRRDPLTNTVDMAVVGGLSPFRVVLPIQHVETKDRS